MSEEKSGFSWIGFIVKLIIVIVVIILGFGIMKFLTENGPEANKEIPAKIIPTVKTMIAEAGSQQLMVKSHGRVSPSRETQAASEVMGRVVKVADRFKAGGSFAADDILLEIDSADYVSALATAEASVADAKLLLNQEEARAIQAARDWAKLGRGEASDLVLRKPQISSAKARVTAAEASVSKALRDLDRTKLRAPYDCQVAATYTDLGSYVSPGMRLADLYSSDSYEVRISLALEELAYLNSDAIIGSEVSLKATLGGESLSWKGKVARNENVIDQQTMTLNLVVSIEPNTATEVYPLPPSGLFVDAEITGKSIDQVVEIPRSALQAGDTVNVLADGKLKILPVIVARKQTSTVLISEGIPNGAKVIVSPMETVMSGMELEEAAE